MTLLQHTAVDGTYEYRPRQTLQGVEAQQSLLGAAAPQQRPGQQIRLAGRTRTLTGTLLQFMVLGRIALRPVIQVDIQG